jgi:hypothetical protein
MLVGLVFGLSEMGQPESGLLATTVMGMTLANQKFADVEHIVEFKEHLRILLISGLFIVLAARLDVSELARVGWSSSLLFVATLVVVARPVSVLIATAGSALSLRERLFMCWVAPRGIVAAAVASVLAGDTPVLVAVTFMVILCTVVLYGLTGPFVAHRLGVAERNPQGVLLVGADAWARAVADALSRHGFRVLLVDTNRQHVAAARLAGLETHNDSVLAEHIFDDLELGGLGRLIATTPNDWVNALATQKFVRVFGRGEVYQLRPLDDESETHRHLHGRWLFGEGRTFVDLARRMRNGAVVKSTAITDEFTWESYREYYGERAVPMFIITDQGRLNVLSEKQTVDPTPGQTLVSLVEGESAGG